MLTVGIVLGAEWAYMELGWGGYWAWDPVENASLLPWLTGTALLHAAILQLRRGIFKRWTAGLVAIGASALIGAMIGGCVTRIGLNHFIASLAFMVIVRGLCLALTQGTPQSLFSLPAEFKFIGQGTLFGIPAVILIFLAIVVASDFVLRRSTLLRRVFYTGSNEKAALYSGIRVGHVKFWVTVLCSASAGLAGVIYTARFGAATPTFGMGMELNVIAAAVIGGTSFSGGVGTVAGAVLGALVMQSLVSGMVLMGIEAPLQDIVVGIVLVVAVALDTIVRRRSAR